MVYQWNGKGASRKEKVAAMNVAARIKRERGGKAQVVLCAEGAEPYEFWCAVLFTSESDTPHEGSSSSSWLLTRVRPQVGATRWEGAGGGRGIGRGGGRWAHGEGAH